MATMAQLTKWLATSGQSAEYRRLTQTALRALEPMRLPKEPDDVIWFAGHADVLATRLLKAGRTKAATSSTYASRLRSVAREFLRAQSVTGHVAERRIDPPTRFTRTLAKVPLPVSAPEEIAEAALMIGRWPSLALDLLPALVRAMERLGLTMPSERASRTSSSS